MMKPRVKGVDSMEQPKDWETVSIDTAYSEVSADIRQVREFQFSSARWYTAILVAISGFILATKFGGSDPPSALQQTLNSHLGVQILVAFVISAVALFSSWTIFYAHRLHVKLRHYLDRDFPLKNVAQRGPVTLSSRLPPRYFFVATQVLIAVATDILLFLR
jgi:hypothetical protein